MDCAVIGGGVMGLAAAWRLALRGVNVRLFEQFEIGHDRGSSHGPTRIFRFLYDDQVYVRMAQAVLPMWREMGDDLLEMTGGVQVDSPETVARSVAAMRACDAAVEEVAVDSLPWLAAENDLAAIFVPDMGVLRADLVIERLHRLCLDAGVDVRANTAADEAEAEVTVVAAGAWVTRFVDIPVRVTREHVVYFKRPDDVMPFVHGRGHWIYGVPGDSLKIAEHGTGPVVDPDEPGAVDDRSVARVVDYVSEFLPTVDPEPIGADTCLYTTTPDHDFVLDRRDDVVVCSPCSGHGFKFAPLVGEICASLVLEKTPPVPIERFSLDR